MRVRLIHGLGSDLTMGSRFYLAYTDASQPSIADLNTMATFIRTQWGISLAGQMSNQGLLEQVIIDDVANATGNQGVDSTSVAGTRAGNPVDQQSCLQLNFKIGRHYRGGKPKCFLPWGIQSDASGAATWTAAFASGAATQWAAFITAINGHTSGGLTAGAQVSVSYFHGPKSNTNPSVWSRKNVPNPRGTPVVDSVIGVTGARIIVTLRRRESRP
jgi:hypothetical protein